jgi:drug/metabolite transporter (DMT)-like permease
VADTLTEASTQEPRSLALQRPKAHALAYGALAVGALALGVSALLVRWAAAPGPVTGFYRMGLASLLLAPFALRSKRGSDSIGRPWPEAGMRLALLAGVALAIDLALWNTAVNVTTVANATLFANTAPLWVALGAWLLFRERLRPLFWGGLALTLLGAASIAGVDFLRHASLGWGDLLAVGASLFYAAYYLITQRGRQHLPPLPYVWMAGMASTAVLLILSLALGMPLVGYPPSTYLAFLGLALVTQVVGYLSVAYALGHLPASIVSPTMVSQPVISGLLAIPILGEMLTLPQVFGGLAVIAGVILVHRSRNGDSSPSPS